MELGSELRTELGLSLRKVLGTPLSVGALDGTELGKKLPLGPSLGATIIHRFGKELGTALGERLGFKLGTELGLSIGKELGTQLSVGGLDGAELG
jgi:hypothetical protein